MLKNRQNSFESEAEQLKILFVDTFVSTKGLFLMLFYTSVFKIDKRNQSLKVHGVKIVTQNTLKSWVTLVFSSFWVTILRSTPYENGLFLRSEVLLGDYFDASSAVVTQKLCPARFALFVKGYDRN